MSHKSGFVNIVGKPNAGKSTLLNALVGEKLAITSPKVQTTRQRILGIRTEPGYQIVFSDTPGWVEPRYKLQERMMRSLKSALEDADLVLWLMDAREDLAEGLELLNSLRIQQPVLVVLNKIDLLKKTATGAAPQEPLPEGVKGVLRISAQQGVNTARLLQEILRYLPEAPAFYPEDTLTDRSMRFLVSELIREQIFLQYQEEIPYHSAVMVQRFEQKPELTKIAADIIVQRETQKGILLGAGGKAIKKLGTEARLEIEKLVHTKVFLELHVKVRHHWRDNDTFLKEYGYA